MHITPILITFLGCATAANDYPNPTPASEEEPDARELEEAVYREGEETIHQLWSPSPRLTKTGAAIYELAPIVAMVDGEEGSLLLNVAADFKSVELLVFPPEAYFETWRVDLPLVEEATSHTFVITTPLYQDLMEAWRLDGSIIDRAPWPTWVDLRDPPVSKECTGHDLNFVVVQFPQEGYVRGGTICTDDERDLVEGEVRGFAETELPYGGVVLFFVQ